ncbi:MAG: ribonuclease [Candidatus Dependentiae bacterium]|nr:ribonuclease [Candidatus Dependentiae bacterium]
MFIYQLLFYAPPVERAKSIAQVAKNCRKMSKTPAYPDYYEALAWKKGQLVCGIDEVGRGCLAGPLVVAAAILPAHCPIDFRDSKKMTPKARDKAFKWLVEHAAYAIARADHAHIAKYNIYQATLYAMRKAVLMLASRQPTLFGQVGYITVDAMPLTLPAGFAHPPIASFIKGEDYSRSIAAASIIAKVTRDRLMAAIQHFFPAYQFGKDKAYASPTHCATLKSKPATFIHRTQFITTVRTPKEKRNI